MDLFEFRRYDRSFIRYIIVLFIIRLISRTIIIISTSHVRAIRLNAWTKRCSDSVVHGVMLSELNKFHNFVRVYLSTYLSVYLHFICHRVCFHLPWVYTTMPRICRKRTLLLLKRTAVCLLTN